MARSAASIFAQRRQYGDERVAQRGID